MKFAIMMRDILVIIFLIFDLNVIICESIRGIRGIGEEGSCLDRIITGILVAPVFVRFVVSLLKKNTPAAIFTQAYARIVSVLNTNFTEVLLPLVIGVVLCVSGLVLLKIKSNKDKKSSGKEEEHRN